MSRYKHMYIVNIHIAEGFHEDCEDLIQRCLCLGTLNYITFCNVWKELGFRYIYQGRTLGAEIAELSEECIEVAKRFMFVKTENFRESLAGLYLMYALLTQQPYPNFAWLRITPDDVSTIKELEAKVRQHKQPDALYILGCILTKYTQYHAVERERGFDPPVKKYLDGCLNINQNGIKVNGIFKKQNDELDMLKELSTIARRYTQCRDAVNGKNKKYVNENLPVKLSSSLKSVINGYEVKDITETEARSNVVQSIKQKAMTSSVNPLSHLMTARDKKERTSSKKKESGTVPSTISKASRRKEAQTLKTADFFTTTQLDEEDSDTNTNDEGIDKTIPNKVPVSSDDESSVKIHSLKPIRAYKRKTINSLSRTGDNVVEKSDSTSDSDSDGNQKVYRQGKNMKISKLDDSNKSKANVETVTNAPFDIVNKTDTDVKAIHVTKEVLPIVIQSDEGEKKCEIEIIDYASNKEVPVKKILSKILVCANDSLSGKNSK
ncbi:unnamed protein product [Leptosia nina]|uniref:snRNA-activating protein complex subunit 1 n=1 Tax=Leptosia nina TaxID=320188 RepID=A0AAV1J379_9NEOP